MEKITLIFSILLTSIFISPAPAWGSNCFDFMTEAEAGSTFQTFKEILIHNSRTAKTREHINRVNETTLATFQKMFPGTKSLSEILDDPTIHLRRHVDLPRISFEEVSSLLREQNVPQNIINSFELIDVKGKRLADGADHFGQILVHKTAVQDTLQFFNILYKNDVPIGPIVPAQLFGGSDAMMVAANITSGVNIRLVSGSLKSEVEVSFHSYGIAIDVNPRLNRWQKDPHKDPLLHYGYNPATRGTLVADSQVINEIESLTGYRWGGYWERPDPQHFTLPFLARSLQIKEVDN